MTEDWLEKAISAATERGDFDDLPGVGKPIAGLGTTYDPAWWAKAFVGREQAREAGIELMADIERLLPSLLAARDLDDLADQVGHWNEAIGRINTKLGAADQLNLIDFEVVERRWRALRR